jgi:hypothetical protein
MANLSLYEKKKKNENENEYEKYYKNIFKKTNLILTNILNKALDKEINLYQYSEKDKGNDNNNDNKNITLIKKLLTKKEILNYNEYINKYIFLIPEFYFYYFEEKLKKIRIINLEKIFIDNDNDKDNDIDIITNEKQQLTIYSIIEKLKNLNLPFELNEENLKENKEKFDRNKEYCNNKIIKILEEINKIKNEDQKLELIIDEENNSITLKKKEIIYKMNKILNEDLEKISEKINEIKKSELIKENEFDIFFEEFNEFKINFTSCLYLFKEKNTLNSLENFNFQFLLKIFEKKEKENLLDLENTKKEITNFLNEKLKDNFIYKKNFEFKKDLLKKILKKEEINNKIIEEINIMKNKQDKLTSDIRKKKENFLSEKEKLSNENFFFQIKNRYSVRVKLILIIIFIFVLYFLKKNEELVKGYFNN